MVDQLVQGWPHTLFLDSTRLGHLCCPVCHDVQRDAVICQPCGKSFCANCVQGLNECPTCRQPCHTWTPNRDLREMILGQDVRCSNSDECNWTGPLSTLEDHTQDTCMFTLLSCPFSDLLGCGCQRVPRGEAAEYHYSRNVIHVELIRQMNSRKRARADAGSSQDDEAEAADGDAEVEEEPESSSPVDEVEAAGDGDDDSGEAVDPGGGISVHAACLTVEQLMDGQQQDLSPINVALQQLVDLLPPIGDKTAEAAESRQQVSARVLEFVEKHARRHVGFQHSSRKLRPEAARANQGQRTRAELCLELRRKVDGPAGKEPDEPVCVELSVR